MLDGGNSFELNSKQHVISLFLYRIHPTQQSQHPQSQHEKSSKVSSVREHKACGSERNDCDRDQALMQKGEQYKKFLSLFCEFACHGEKIYFSCFDNKKHREIKKERRKATKTTGLTCGCKKCLCFVFRVSFISTATCYQYVKYFRISFISTQFVTFAICINKDSCDIDNEPERALFYGCLFTH